MFNRENISFLYMGYCAKFIHCRSNDMGVRGSQKLGELGPLYV